MFVKGFYYLTANASLLKCITGSVCHTTKHGEFHFRVIKSMIDDNMRKYYTGVYLPREGGRLVYTDQNLYFGSIGEFVPEFRITTELGT